MTTLLWLVLFAASVVIHAVECRRVLRDGKMIGALMVYNAALKAACDEAEPLPAMRRAVNELRDEWEDA